MRSCRRQFELNFVEHVCGPAGGRKGNGHVPYSVVQLGGTGTIVTVTITGPSSVSHRTIDLNRQLPIFQCALERDWPSAVASLAHQLTIGELRNALGDAISIIDLKRHID